MPTFLEAGKILFPRWLACQHHGVGQRDLEEEYVQEMEECMSEVSVSVPFLLSPFLIFFRVQLLNMPGQLILKFQTSIPLSLLSELLYNIVKLSRDGGECRSSRLCVLSIVPHSDLRY